MCYNQYPTEFQRLFGSISNHFTSISILAHDVPYLHNQIAFLMILRIHLFEQSVSEMSFREVSNQGVLLEIAIYIKSF